LFKVVPAMQDVLLIFHLENFTGVRKAIWKGSGGRTVNLIISKQQKLQKQKETPKRTPIPHVSLVKVINR
jgi:hypothetical protein